MEYDPIISFKFSTIGHKKERKGGMGEGGWNSKHGSFLEEY